MSVSEMFDQLRRPAKHDFKVGDIVDWDWDYDHAAAPIRCRIVRLGRLAWQDGRDTGAPGAELEMVGPGHMWRNECAPLSALTPVEPAAPADGGQTQP